MKITEATWMFLDTETTGLKPEEGAQIIELGWVIVKKMQIVGSQDFLINPGKPIPPEITRLTHITDDMVADKGPFFDAAAPFLNAFRSCDFIAAYNKDFDRKMLDAEFQRLGASLPEKTWFDPLTWARKFSGASDNKLATIAKQFKVSLENAHRADADSAASVEVMLKFFEWGVDEAAFPDDVEMLKNSERMWRNDANAKARLDKSIKKNMTGRPGEMAPDIYDSYYRQNADAYLHELMLKKTGRWKP
jgi:DNA polymerase III epsilon subunit family exonuclease